MRKPCERCKHYLLENNNKYCTESKYGRTMICKPDGNPDDIGGTRHWVSTKIGGCGTGGRFWVDKNKSNETTNVTFPELKL